MTYFVFLHLILYYLQAVIVRTAVLDEGISHVAKGPRLSKRQVIYPSPEDKCEVSGEGTKTLCLELSRCSSFSMKMKPCGWNGLEPKVCCVDKNGQEAARITLNCGIQYTPSASSFLIRRRKRQMRGKRAQRDFSIAVAGGEEVKPLSFPWMAAVERTTDGTNYRFLCGASLISQRHVLTAAHCIAEGEELTPERFSVRLLAHSRRIGGTIYEVRKVSIHPDYNYRENYNDIAVITLSSDVPMTSGVNPICLPDDETSAGRNLTNFFAEVLGWGRTSFGGKDSQVLLQAALPIVETSDCNRAYQAVATRSFSRGINDDFVCAGYQEGGKDACQNDSGGPLQILTNGRWEQIGIVSFGYGCAEPGFPGVYTNVTRYVPWIHYIMSVT